MTDQPTHADWERAKLTRDSTAINIAYAVAHGGKVEQRWIEQFKECDQRMSDVSKELGA